MSGIGDFLGGVGDYISDGVDWVADEVNDAYNRVARGGLPDDNTLSQSDYGFSYKTFPSDLGMSYAGHYMVININVPITFDSARIYNNPTIATDLPITYTLLPDELSKVDVLRFGSQTGGPGINQSDSVTSRRTRRIKESIALYMPGTQLVYNGMNAYEEISMTALAGQLATGAIATGSQLLASYFGGGAIGAAINAVTGQAADFGNAAGNLAGGVLGAVGTAAKLAGRPINPRVEVLFAMTPLRDFQFEFHFMPRNEEEARSVREIIRTLRFHSAPELDHYGINFIPPAEFDITFYSSGRENINIPRINTCVLTRCEVDYAPGTGMFASYNDGMPISTRLMLVFREVEPVHKLRVLQGF